MKRWMAAAGVALLGLTIPGLVFADDDDDRRRGGGRVERDDDRDDRKWERKQERRAYKQGFKDGRRYDGRRYEGSYVDVQPRWSRGQVLPYEYRRGVVYDPLRFGLYAPPRGYAWINVGPDVYLTALADGSVVEVVRDGVY